MALTTMISLKISSKWTLIARLHYHWRTGADDEGGGFDDDANSRLMYHELDETPSVAINGFQENITDVKPQIIENEIDIDWTVQLIGSSEVELINITATWTNPQTLNAATQLHVFIIETKRSTRWEEKSETS